MKVWFFDKNMTRVLLVDEYESLIWTDRYDEYGDFELKMAMSMEIYELIKKDFYVRLENSPRMMLINNIHITSDKDEGYTMTFKGCSLEYLLSRRVLWGKSKYSGNLQDIIKDMVTESIISPEDATRKIDNFEFVYNNDEEVTKHKKDPIKFQGENLYTAIKDLCREFDLGFKLLYDFEDSKFKFQLFSGVDRSLEQDKVIPVYFKTDLDNLSSSDYDTDNTEEANVSMVIGNKYSRPDPDSKEKGSEVVTKNGSKSISGTNKHVVETTTTVVKDKKGNQMSRTVEVVDTWTKTNDDSYEKKITDTKEYNAVDHLVSSSRTETFKSSTTSGSTTTTTETSKEISDNESESVDKSSTTVTKETKDSEGFVTSSTKTTTYDKDVTEEKDKTLKFSIGLVDSIPTGINRKEMVVDAQNVKAKDEDNNPIDESEYNDQLKSKATRELKKFSNKTSLTGKTHFTDSYVYGEDYFIGDIVQLENEYGITSKSRITEMIYSHSSNEISLVPTFVAVTDKE